MPYPPGDYGRLPPSGNLFYCGKTAADSVRFPTWPLFRGGAVLEADWQGNVLWELRHPDHHHDARLMANGNVLLLAIERVPSKLAAQVQGGIPAIAAGSGVWADRILEGNK